MKASEIMSAHPVVVPAGERDEGRLRDLMTRAGVSHLPIVEEGHLRGAWALGEEVLVELGPDKGTEVDAGADAEEVMAACLADAELVLVGGAGAPAGVITRSDVLAVLRTALDHGIGRRHRRPTVIRIAGREGAGKTTLIRRSLPHLARFDAVVVQANAAAAGPDPGQTVPEVVDPSAHWRAGLHRLLGRLSDSELILLEDRDGEPDLARGIGEDAQVAVVPAADAGQLSAELLADAQAVVLTWLEALAPAELAEAVDALGRRVPGVAVFAVALADDDPGFLAWIGWIDVQVMRNRG